MAVDRTLKTLFRNWINLCPEPHSPCPTLHICRVQAEGWPVNPRLGPPEGNTPNPCLHWNCRGLETPRGSSRGCTFNVHRLSALSKHTVRLLLLLHTKRPNSYVYLVLSYPILVVSIKCYMISSCQWLSRSFRFKKYDNIKHIKQYQLVQLCNVFYIK